MISSRYLHRTVTALLLLGCSVAHGQAEQQQALTDAVNAYSSLIAIEQAPQLSQQQAEEVQRMLVLSLRPLWGEVVGYKAALTSKPAQERFGVSHPVTGVLLENMFTSTGSTISVADGVTLLLEADLLVRVGEESFNTATNEEEALAGLSQVIPFIEVPDLMFGKDVKINGANVSAINAGARFGVMGHPVDLAGIEDAAERLANFSVKMTDADNNELGRGMGKMLMGHPLKAALWLRDDLKRQGIDLKPGDLLSLGGMSRPRPLVGIKRVKAVYSGLADEPVTIHIGVR